MKVSVKDIVIPEERARARYTEEQREYLRASLGKYGQLSDILVRGRPGGGYELIDGESRLKELVEGGAVDVDVKVLALDNHDAAMVNILMNVARGEQDPMGISLALHQAKVAGMPTEQLAEATGHTFEWVQFMLQLRELPTIYQEALRRGDLLVTHIRQATRLPNPREVDAALGAAVRHGWNTAVMKNYCNNRLKEFMAVRLMKERTGVEVPPPQANPEKLARYSQCLVCGDMRPNDELSLPRVCDECYTFSKYAVAQVGKGEAGMKTLYRALELLQAWQQQKRQLLLEEDLSRHPVAPATSEEYAPEPVPEPEGPIVKPGWMSAEEWGALKKHLQEQPP